MGLPRDARSITPLCLSLGLSEESLSEGALDPLTGLRQIFTGSDSQSAVARMASIHEHQHEFLNQSTCYGNALKFVAALALKKLDIRFSTLLQTMVDKVREPHEVFATVTGLYHVDRERFDLRLLADYPEYLDRARKVASVIDLNEHPDLGIQLFSSAVRSALQTNILEEWGKLPCPEWSLDDLATTEDPEVRLNFLLNRELFDRALTEVGEQLRRRSPAWRQILDGSLTAEERIEIHRRIPYEQQDLAVRLSFAPFARALKAAGFGTTDDGRNRRDAPAVIRRLVDFAGPQIEAEIWGTTSTEEDQIAFWRSIASETLLTRKECDFARVWDLDSMGTAALELFRLGPPDAQYFQVVAMPHVTARHLYIDESIKPLFQGSAHKHLLALRCRTSSPDTEPLIHLLPCKSLDQLMGRLGDLTADADFFCLFHFSSWNDEVWRPVWKDDSRLPPTSMAVLIDLDPIALLEALAGDVERVEMHFAYPEFEDLGATYCVVAFVVGDEWPIFFAPCTVHLKQALEGWVEKYCPHVEACYRPELWAEPRLQRAVAHAIREQHRFAFDQPDP